MNWSKVLEEAPFQTLFQPIVNILDGSTVAYEALSRPIDFLKGIGIEPLIRESIRDGFSAELEQLLMHKSLNSYPRGLPQTLLLNGSPEHLQTLIPVLLPYVKELRLGIELTEGYRITRYSEVNAQLSHLRDAGVRLLLDDVGAGYADLETILELRPDVVKVDRRWVASLGRSGTGNQLVATVVQLAKSVGASVLAEGVETEDEWLGAKRLGFDYAQGYYIARPNAVTFIPSFVPPREEIRQENIPVFALSDPLSKLARMFGVDFASLTVIANWSPRVKPLLPNVLDQCMQLANHVDGVIDWKTVFLGGDHLRSVFQAYLTDLLTAQVDLLYVARRYQYGLNSQRSKMQPSWHSLGMHTVYTAMVEVMTRHYSLDQCGPFIRAYSSLVEFDKVVGLEAFRTDVQNEGVIAYGRLALDKATRQQRLGQHLVMIKADGDMHQDVVNRFLVTWTAWVYGGDLFWLNEHTLIGSVSQRPLPEHVDGFNQRLASYGIRLLQSEWTDAIKPQSISEFDQWEKRLSIEKPDVIWPYSPGSAYKRKLR